MLTEPIRMLSPDDMERIHAAAVKILADTGMQVESPQARDCLVKAGCRIDAAGRVRFPPPVTQTAVDRMRADYARPGRVPAAMAVRYSHVRFRRETHRIHRDFTLSTGGFCCFIRDLEGRRRTATRDDTLRAVGMANALDQIAYTGLPVADQQVPAAARPAAMAGLLATYSHKFGGVEAFRVEDVPYLVEIGTIVKGSADALRREPILVGYGEARSPLCLDRNMADIFIEYIRRGLPQTLDTMPNAGATGPVTAAGLLALAAAETLCGLVLAYAVDENAVVGIDINPSSADMRTGVFGYGSPARWPLLAARVQLVSEYYGCPSGVHGAKTDSCFTDVQTGVEKAATMLLPVLAGAVGIGTAGHVENAITFSPQQLVIDNEICRAVRHLLRPIVVDETTLALDAVAEVGPGGQFLSSAHTAEHFRDAGFLSALFRSDPWDAAHGPAGTDLARAAADRARELWSALPEPVLDDDRRRAVEAVVRHAARAVSGTAPGAVSRS
jgi:trimethylamine--corrinoid protein Co-methyltransferase